MYKVTEKALVVMQRKRNLLQAIIWISDMIMLSIGYILAFFIRFFYLENGIIGGDYLMLYWVVVILYALIFYLAFGKERRLSPGLSQDILELIKNHVYMGLLVLAFLFVMKSGVEYSRLQIFLFLGISLILTVISRRLVRFIFTRRFANSSAVEQMVLISAKENIKQVLSELKKEEQWYYRIMGVCIIDADMKGAYVEGIKVLAGRDDMLSVLAKESLDSVLICDSGLSNAVLGQMVEQLQTMGITTHVKIVEAGLAQGYRQFDTFGSLDVVSYTGEKRDIRLRVLRRGTDVILGLLGTLLCVITYPVVAVLILGTSGGPVTVSHVRVGRNGRRFHVYCYRTMKLSRDGRGDGVSVEKTVVGRFLAWSGLQCLPLFFHLLNGNISLIGQKAPSLPVFMSYTPGQRKCMCMKPGLLKTWVCGRTFDETEQKNELCIWQQERINLFGDEAQEKEFLCGGFGILCYHAWKRFLDIVLSLCAIIVTSPLWLVLYLLIFFCDGHNPIYSQVRIGLHGKKICIYKFRSMHYQSDDLERLLTPEQLLQYKKEFKLTDDPRVTVIGKFLRRSSLDELPQLFNILKGDLSFIGPRPIVAKETIMYGNDIVTLLSVKPGLTGYWQAYARNHAGYETGERQKMELYYVSHESPWLDIRIFFKTIAAVITGNGAV